MTRITVSRREAAAALGVSIASIDRYIENKRLIASSPAGKKRGSRVLILASSIEALFAGEKEVPVPPPPSIPQDPFRP